MDKSYELKYHKIEEDYWWFKARRDMLFKLIKLMNKNSKILEIGCSSGVLIKFLKKKGFNNIFGIDISKNAINLCKKRGLKDVFIMNGEKLGFDNEEFDIIIALDVLEHIKNDKLALIEWNRVIKPNGILIVFVPAFNFLWSEQDEISHHYRRYSKLELVNVLKKDNFEVEKSSYWNISLFLPVSLIRFFQRIFLKNKRPKDQLYKVNPIINKLFMYLLKFENQLLTKISFPFGISVFVIARKKFTACNILRMKEK